MAKQSETGHEINLANLAALISFCKSFGTKYNPSTAELTIAALEQLYNLASLAINGFNTARSAYDKAANERLLFFTPLRKYVTRIINGLDSTKASKETVKDARRLNRKLTGKRAPGNNVKEKTTDPSAQTPKERSVSQQSYDMLVAHFTNLVEMLKIETHYAPNEADLTVDSLSKHLDSLRAYNQAVIDADTTWTNSRIHRQALLYTEETGLVGVALNVKKYVLSVFDASSPDYKKVKRLAFKTLKD